MMRRPARPGAARPPARRRSRRPGYDRAALARRHGAYRRRRLPPLPPGRIHRRHARAAASTAGASSASTSARRRSPTRSAGRTASTPACSAPATASRPASSAASSRVVDSQAGPAPALAVLAAPAIDVVTLTVTEKGYCHRPAERRARPRPSRHRPRPRPPGDAAQPARPHRRGRWSCRMPIARPADHAGELRQHPRQRRHPRRRRRARSPSGAARPRRLDRRQRRLPLDHGRPHRPGDDAGRPRRRSSAAYGYRDSAVGGRRAVPPVGDRGPLRRPRAALGSRRRQLRRRRHARSSSSRCASSTPRSRRSPISACWPATSTPATPSPTRCSPPSSAAC